MKMSWPMRLTVLVCGVFVLMSCTVQGTVDNKQTQLQTTHKAQDHSISAHVGAPMSVQGKGQSNGTVAVKDAHKKDIVVGADKSVLARIKATLMQYRILSGMAVLAAGAGLYFFNKIDAKQDSNTERQNGNGQKGSGVKQNSGQKSKSGSNSQSGVLSSSTSSVNSALGDLAGSGQEIKLGKKSAHVQSTELITQEDESGYRNGIECGSNGDDSINNTDVSVSSNSQVRNIVAVTTKQNQSNSVKSNTSARVQQARQTAQNTQRSAPKQSSGEGNKKKGASITPTANQQKADQALRDAVNNRDAAGVKKAVDNGANIYQVADEATGRTLFMDAVRNGRSSVVEEFLKKEKELSKGIKNKQQLVHRLVHRYDKLGRTPLMYMCDDEYYDRDMINMLSILIRYGANIDAKDGEGCTALLLAIKKYDEDRVRCEMTGGQEERCIVKELRRHGANIYLTDNDGVTTLMWAVKKNNPSAFELLCDYEVGIDAQGKRCLVAIERDRWATDCYTNIDQKLRAFVNAIDKKKKTALMYAVDIDSSAIRNLRLRGAARMVPDACEPDIVKYAILKDRVNSLSALMGINSGKFEGYGSPEDTAAALRFAIEQEQEHTEVVSILYKNITLSVASKELREEWDKTKENSVPTQDADVILKQHILASITDMPNTLADIIIAYAPRPFKDERLDNKLLGIACGQGHVNNVKTLLGQSKEVRYNMYKDELVQEYADTSYVQENAALKQVFDAALKKIEKNKKQE